LRAVAAVVDVLHPDHARETPADDAGAVAERERDVRERSRHVVDREHEIPLLADANAAAGVGVGDVHVGLAQPRGRLLAAVTARAVEAAEEVHLDAAAAAPRFVELRAGEVEPETRVAHVETAQRAAVAHHRVFRVRTVAEGKGTVLREAVDVDETVQRDGNALRRREHRLGFFLRCGRRWRRRWCRGLLLRDLFDGALLRVDLVLDRGEFGFELLHARFELLLVRRRFRSLRGKRQGECGGDGRGENVTHLDAR
jgi:hypothetical protein